MKINGREYENCTYVAGFLHNSLGLKCLQPAGHVEVGGDPDMPQYLQWVNVVSAKRDGLIGYKIFESEYPKEGHQIGKAFTRAGAERKIYDRLSEIAEDISRRHGLPVVGVEEALRERDRADAIVCERLEAQRDG